MREPLSRPCASLRLSRDPFLYRIRENLEPARIPSSAKGAPLDALRSPRSLGLGGAQGASLLTHAAIIAALLLAAVHPPGSNPRRSRPGEVFGGILRVPNDLLGHIRGLREPAGKWFVYTVFLELSIWRA